MSMKSYLRSLNLLSEADLELLNGLTTTKTIPKGEFLIKEGSVCKQLVYIKEGILRSFYSKDNGEEITYCITFGNNLMTALSSLITGQPTEENIQALTELSLEVLKKDDLNALYVASPHWLKAGKVLTEIQYIELEKRMFLFQKHSAKKRYEEFMESHASYLQHIPLQYLASYLNITPRHLSRLRRELIL